MPNRAKWEGGCRRITAPARWILLAVRAAGPQAALDEHPGTYSAEEDSQSSQPCRNTGAGAANGSLDVVSNIARCRYTRGSGSPGR